MTASAKADIFALALGLWAGFGYGRFHFSMNDRNKLEYVIDQPEQVESNWSPALEEIQQQQGEQLLNSFAQLANKVKELEKKDPSSLAMVLQIAAGTLHMNINPERNHYNVPLSAIRAEIQLPDMFFREPKSDAFPLYYFYLSSKQLISSSIIAKLVIMLIQNAIDLHRTAAQQGIVPPPPRVRLICDEWQATASANSTVPQLLSQGGGEGIDFIVANQDLEQLNQADSDLRTTTLENVGVKVVFGSRDVKTMELLMGMSGEKAVYQKSFSFSSDGTEQVTYNEVIRPLVERTSLVRMNAQEYAYCILPKDEGVAQTGGLPFFLDAPHRYTPDDYKYLTRKAKWPKPTSETIVPSDYLFSGNKFAYFKDIPGANCNVRN